MKINKIKNKVFLDSCVVVAYLFKKDAHYNDVLSLINFINKKYIKPFNTEIFVINEIIYIEIISILLQNKIALRKAIKLLDSFCIDNKVTIISSEISSFKNYVLTHYKKYNRYKFKKLNCNDFIILADVISSSSILATCDNHFFKYSANNFKDVYFVSSKSKKYKDQYAEFTNRVLTLISSN